MDKFKYLLLSIAGGALLLIGGCTVRPASAQFAVGVGSAPDCPWGYYDYAPYACAPYGYYGPEWFSNGVFIGVGPWFHGPANFRGHVDNHFDAHHGYKGPMPARGTPREAGRSPMEARNFHGNETRDGRGHAVK